MIKLVTVSQMQEIEREAATMGLTNSVLMDKAGLSLAQTIIERFMPLKQGKIFGLVGTGNNGGDTLVALTYLARQGWQAHAYLARSRPPEDALVTELKDAGGLIYNGADDPEFKILKSLVEDSTIFLDGVLGTGFKLPLKPPLLEIIGFVNDYLNKREVSPIVIAVDCPSGIDCNTGEAADKTIPAKLTVTMAAIKSGLLKFPAYNFVGDLVVGGIGLPEGGAGMASWNAVNTFVPDSAWVKRALPPRPFDAHKGTFGTALIVAGSLNYTGAAWLAGQAAYRIGAGLVTLAVPEPLHLILAGNFPEATWLLLPESEGFIDAAADEMLINNLDRITGLLIGPGLGQHQHTAQFLFNLLLGRPRKSMGFFGDLHPYDRFQGIRLPPLVVDADGLKLLKQMPDWNRQLPPNSILTPHPGEMSILTGLSKDEIQSDRINVALKYSEEWQQIVVLKGAFTVVASPDGQAAVIPIATPALARAGTGDILAGMIVGLLAQGVPAFESAVAGAWLHGKSGLNAAQKHGNDASVLAGDLIESLISVLSNGLTQDHLTAG